MSLWTPGGEHEVPKNRPGQPAEPATAPPADSGPPSGPPPSAADLESMPEFDQLSPEEQDRARAMAAEMAEAQQRVLETPAEVIVANHAMGLFELAAIHLNAQEPNLEAARLAIDALGAVLDRVGNQLGDATESLTEAHQQAQMAAVQLASQA